MTTLAPIAAALFLWWFGTGAAFWAVKRLERAAARTMIVVTALGLLAAIAGVVSVDELTTEGVYLGFASALVIWGWHELAFLGGWLTGPRKIGAEAGLSIGPRFVQATASVLHHELALAATVAASAAVAWNAPNPTFFWTFTLLWAMRLSAKLNIFLGVANDHPELLPSKIAYLASYFGEKNANLLFPITVTAATMSLGWLCAAIAGGEPGAPATIAHLLVATLLAAAILEHWFLILPVRDTALWQWFLERRKEPERRPYSSMRIAS